MIDPVQQIQDIKNVIAKNFIDKPFTAHNLMDKLYTPAKRTTNLLYIINNILCNLCNGKLLAQETITNGVGNWSAGFKVTTEFIKQIKHRNFIQQIWDKIVEWHIYILVAAVSVGLTLIAVQLIK